MPIELTAHTDAGARLVAIAEELSEELAARAAEHDRDGTLSLRGDRRAQGRRLLRGARPRRARRARRLVRARPRRRVEPPGARRRLGRDRREHAPRRGAQHGAPSPGRRRGRGGAPRPRLRLLARADRPRRRRAGRRHQRARAGPHAAGHASPPAPSRAGGSTAASCSAPCPPPPPISTWPSPTPTATASSATRTRWCPTDAPGVVVHDDWDALGMRASGSNSVSLEGVELPESGVRGGFRAGDPLPYMERNLVAGLFHAAASLGIAESADAIARRGIAGRINGDARPRMQVADNAVDLAASRGVLSRAAALIDEHRAANPASDGSAERARARCSPRPRPPRRSSTRRPPASWTARSPSPAAPATSTAARSRAPTATSRPAPSCTRSAPTAPTTTSATSRSARRPSLH